MIGHDFSRRITIAVRAFAAILLMMAGGRFILPAFANGGNVRVHAYAFDDPASPIELIDAVVVQQDQDNNAVECAYFVNRSSRVVTRVRVRFVYVSSNGKNVGSDIVEANGPYDVGVPVEFSILPASVATPRPYNCKRFDRFAGGIGDGASDEYQHVAYITDFTPVIIVEASLHAYVEEVDFDGGSWNRRSSS